LKIGFYKDTFKEKGYAYNTKTYINNKFNLEECMRKKSMLFMSILVLVSVLLSACGVAPAISEQATNALEEQVNRLLEERLGELLPQAQAAGNSEQPADENPPVDPATPADSGLLAAYQGTLTEIYDFVNPSVVNIRVVSSASDILGGQGLPEIPGLPELPDLPDGGNQPFAQGLGSGFVWDEQGHIVTNNHVVEGAEKIEVTFHDGTVAEAELVGTDPDSDLAVIKVDMPQDQLLPVVMADSDQVKVGQMGIAIGNPYGLDGTMTVGIISALGRVLPSELGLTSGPSYSIPNVIQTDAPINPGNSGGVLVNDQGQVVGVTFAIESASGSSAGIGFVIPSAIVKRVVPSLIGAGVYEHPYLGISGLSLTPDLAEAMNLDSAQRGALVETVVSGGPADEAGLRPSEDQASVDGQSIGVGGDVITAFQGLPVKEMDDLISYLSSQGQVGQEVTLTILRDGQEQEIQVTLGARPTQEERVTQTELTEEPNQSTQPGQPDQPEQVNNKVYLGIVGMTMFTEIAEAMDLPADQAGVLVVEVQPGSPADEAGLLAGNEQLSVQDQTVQIGGDVITQFNGKDVTGIDELVKLIQSSQAGDEVTLTILRNGKPIEIQATLAERSQ
jgi:S1-C subfamily serine protease